MTRLGITGGIGSGKSYVAQMLRRDGIPVYDADSQAKRLTNTSSIIRQQLIQLFGCQIYTNDGNVCRELLASHVFGSPEVMRQVNDIIHPVVRTDFRSWATQHHCPIVAIESAILFEAGFRNEVDYALMVNAPETLRIERAMKRDNASREAIQARIHAQMSDNAKLLLADFVINNDGRDITVPLQQIIHLIKQKHSN